MPELKAAMPLIPQQDFEEAVKTGLEKENADAGAPPAKRQAVSQMASPFERMKRLTDKRRRESSEGDESRLSQRQRRESTDSQSTTVGDSDNAAGMGPAEHQYELFLATLAGVRGDDATVGKDEAERALKHCDFEDNEIEAYFGRMESENRVMISEGTVHFTV